jgi:DMSO/TMAO reductase YedYZ molybdopterin-dependent catalytic subunit
VEKQDEAPASTTAEPARILVRTEPLLLEVSLPRLDAPITATPFVRSHFGIPVLADDHLVRVTGSVEHPFAVSVVDLKEMPRREVVTTLECAGNGRLGMTPLPSGEPWGEGAVSTMVFSGPSLRDLLERAVLRPDAVEVLAQGADSGLPDGSGHTIAFSRSLPLEKALHPDTILAFEMNGGPLPREHGGPVRMVVPGWYGVASVKWISRIEVRDTKFEGWFQSERYIYEYADDLPAEPVTEMRLRALLVSPRDGAPIPRGPVRLGGWAWSSAEVDRVEVSIDGGPWIAALLGAWLGPWAWRPFELTWDADRTGRHTLRARAIDKHGNVQPDWARFNKLGYGCNAIRTVVVEVI